MPQLMRVIEILRRDAPYPFDEYVARRDALPKRQRRARSTCEALLLIIERFVEEHFEIGLVPQPASGRKIAGAREILLANADGNVPRRQGRQRIELSEFQFTLR
jgi:hypothetical protein